MTVFERRPQHRHRHGVSWPTRTLAEDVATLAHRRPDKPAVIDVEGSYTYRELLDATESFANVLREIGVKLADTVVVQLPPIRQFVPAFLGAERLGAVVCPLLPSIDGPALHRFLAMAEPRVVVTIERHGRSQPAREATANSVEGHYTTVVHGQSTLRGMALDDALAAPRGTELPSPPPMTALSELAFTSGSTGQPKGVLHSHATATAGILSTLRRQGIGPDDVVHVALPVGHNFGFFYGVRLALHRGATLVLQNRWNPEGMLRMAQDHHVTVASGPPAYVADLLTARPSWGSSLDSLRLFTCAGAKLPIELAEKAVRTFPGRISKAFGMTELGHTCSTGPDAPRHKIINTEGQPHPEIEMRIFSPDGDELPPGERGLVAFRGPFLFLGYLSDRENRTSPFDDDGFFVTGDLGYRDEDGYLVITGRADNSVIRGGENIPVEDIERVISRHPAVRECAIVGAPDPRLGERPVACMRLVAGIHLTQQELVAFLLRAGVARIHLPEAVIAMDTLPRSETGKLLRAELQRLVADREPFKKEGAGERTRD